MKNYVQNGSTVTLTAPYTVTSGSGVLVGSIFGVAVSDTLSGASGEFAVEGVFTLPKTSALAVSAGDVLWWDNSAKEVNKTASGNKLIGVALSSASNPSATVTVRLNGAFVG